MSVRFTVVLSALAAFGMPAAPSAAQNAPGGRLPAGPAPVRPAPASSDAPPAPAVPDTVPGELDPAAAERLLRQLNDLQEQLAARRASHNTGLLPRLREAASNENKAFDLWMEAMRDVEFEKKGRPAAEFSDFRNGRAKKDRTPEFTAGLRLQARYLSVLVMAAEASTDAAREEAVAAMLQYLDDYVGVVKKLGRSPRVLEENALAGPVAKHLKIDRTVKEAQAGSVVPGRIDEIYEKTILPYYRRRGNLAELLSAWRRRIDQAGRIAAARKSQEATDRFRTEELPELQWGQALDQFEGGQQEAAAAAMIGIIRSNLGHKSAEAWINSLAERLRTPVSPFEAGEFPAISP